METFQIERREFIDNELFKSEYLQGGKPLLLTGYASDWPARQWTLERLKEKVGNIRINVRRNTDVVDYKIGQKYKIENMDFEDYIGNIFKGNRKAKSSYMAVQNIKQAFPQLEDDIVIPSFVEKIHGGPFLWIANQGHYEFCHFDPDDNCLIILNGRKQVKLFGCDVTSMYPNELGSKGRTIQSRVLVNEPDLSSFPNFKDAKCYEVLKLSNSFLKNIDQGCGRSKLRKKLSSSSSSITLTLGVDATVSVKTYLCMYGNSQMLYQPPQIGT